MVCTHHSQDETAGQCFTLVLAYKVYGSYAQGCREITLCFEVFLCLVLYPESHIKDASCGCTIRYISYFDAIHKLYIFSMEQP